MALYPPGTIRVEGIEFGCPVVRRVYLQSAYRVDEFPGHDRAIEHLANWMNWVYLGKHGAGGGVYATLDYIIEGEAEKAGEMCWQMMDYAPPPPNDEAR